MRWINRAFMWASFLCVDICSVFVFFSTSKLPEFCLKYKCNIGSLQDDCKQIDSQSQFIDREAN